MIRGSKAISTFVGAAILLWSVLLINEARCHEYPTNSSDPKDWMSYIASINAKADLGALLHYNTNEDTCSNLEKLLCKSLDIQSKTPMIISYKEFSLIFHNGKTNECLESSQEMGPLPHLVYQNGAITRTNNEEKVLSNYIWIVDPNIKEPMVEIDLLVSVEPIGRPQDVKYMRRSFRYVYRNGWI